MADKTTPSNLRALIIPLAVSRANSLPLSVDDPPVGVGDDGEDLFTYERRPVHVPDVVHALVVTGAVVPPQDVHIPIVVEVARPGDLPRRVRDLTEDRFALERRPFMYQRTFSPW